MTKKFKIKTFAIIVACLALLLVAGTAMAVNVLRSPEVTIERADDGTVTGVTVSLEDEADHSGTVEVRLDADGEVTYAVTENRVPAGGRMLEVIESLRDELGDDVMIQATTDENGSIVVEYSPDGGVTWNQRTW